MNAETILQNKILIALGTYPGMVIWRSAVGNGWVRTKDGFKPMRFGGIPGQADILGCWNGRFIAIEVKTDKGRLRKEQMAWRDAIEKVGGLYIVARSVGEALDGLHKAQTTITLDHVGAASSAEPAASTARVLPRPLAAVEAPSLIINLHEPRK